MPFAKQKLDYDPSRGVPFCGFVYQRVLARAFTRYRQEWTYARQNEPCSMNSKSNETPRLNGIVVSQEPTPCPHEDLHRALATLSEIQLSIIEQIFWNEQTETDLANTLHISQQAVNKRKRLALQNLREALLESAKSSVARL